MTRILRRENPLCIKTEAAINLSQGVFFLTYTLYLIFRTAAETTYKYDNSTKLFTQGAWICCFVAVLSVIFLCRYSVGQLLGILLFLCLCTFIWAQTGKSEFVFLQSMMLIFACRHVQWDRLLKISLVLHVFLILVPAVLEYVRVLPIVELFRGEERRYTLGLSHPNVLGGYLVCLVIIWLLLRYHKLKIYDYAAWLLIAGFSWIVPNSKTATFTILILCVLTFVFKRWGISLVHSRIIQAICLSFFSLMTIFSLLASYFYDANNELYVYIDHALFTTRLSYAHKFLVQYPITLFGQKLELVSSVKAKSEGVQAMILDNFYVRQLMASGIVTLLILLGLFTFLMYKFLKSDQQEMIVALLILMIYCVYESRGANLVYNVLLFQITYQVFQPIGKKKETRAIQTDNL